MGQSPGLEAKDPGAPSALAHLGSPLGLSFLSCEMGMKAAPSSRGAVRVKGASTARGAQHRGEVLTCVN